MCQIHVICLLQKIRRLKKESNSATKVFKLYTLIRRNLHMLTAYSIFNGVWLVIFIFLPFFITPTLPFN